MINHIKNYYYLFAIAILFASCENTYYLSTDSLYKQLSKVKDTAYAYHHKFYDALVFSKLFNNGLDSIHCTDKKGARWKVPDNYTTEVILTLKSGENRRFIFRTMFLKDSVLVGQGALFNAQMHVKFKDITKVRIKAPE